MAQSLDSMRERLRCWPMDALAGLLDGPRARDAFLMRTVMAPPWSVRVRRRGAAVASSPSSAAAAWIVPDGGDRSSSPPATSP